MSISKILVADDEKLIRGFLEAILVKMGYEVTLAKDGKEAIEKISKNNFDLIFTDFKMPFNTGTDVLKFAKKQSPSTVVILMTAFGSIENAVEAIQLGAFNYIIKPFSIEVIETLIKKVHKEIQIIEENKYLRNENYKKEDKIIFESDEMKKIVDDIEKIAKSDASVFIYGESGTGKEVIAKMIHSKSKRKDNPYIKVNCAAITDSLIESEFFGHEKGSFTGADLKKVGRLELADLGTLLLDEITEIPISLQAKLLRAVQEQEFERVGGVKPIKVNIRFISTSNRNMEKAIEKNIFREDLFYRLNVMPIHLLPLRERKKDIMPLAHFFIEIYCKKYRKKIKTFSAQAKEKLLNYPWPGNIRELSNIMERIVVLDLSEKIDIDHLFLSSDKEQINRNNFDENQSLKDLEKTHILKMLNIHKQNKIKTAKALGITDRTLRNKLKEYNL